MATFAWILECEYFFLIGSFWWWRLRFLLLWRGETLRVVCWLVEGEWMGSVVCFGWIWEGGDGLRWRFLRCGIGNGGIWRCYLFDPRIPISKAPFARKDFGYHLKMLVTPSSRLPRCISKPEKLAKSSSWVWRNLLRISDHTLGNTIERLTFSVISTGFLRLLPLLALSPQLRRGEIYTRRASPAPVRVQEGLETLARNGGAGRLFKGGFRYGRLCVCGFGRFYAAGFLGAFCLFLTRDISTDTFILDKCLGVRAVRQCRSGGEDRHFVWVDRHGEKGVLNFRC